MGTVATSTPAGVVPCVGCGGLVPDVAGPTHPYLQASAGCWQLYGEVSARQHGESGSEPGQASVHWHHVDAYAVQHPGGSEHDRRQRQSVAVTWCPCACCASSGSHRSTPRRTEGVQASSSCPDWRWPTGPTWRRPQTSAR